MSQQSEQPIVHLELDLQKENLDFAETGGVSQENGQLSFVPAFIDSTNGRVEISRFSNGLPAPFHSLDGLPDSWVTSQDRAGRVLAVKESVIAGFVKMGRFFTRQEAAEFVQRYS